MWKYTLILVRPMGTPWDLLDKLLAIIHTCFGGPALFNLRDCDSQLLKKHVIINFDQKLLIIIWSDDSIRLKDDSIRIQWKPLNVIIDNVIFQLMWWNWQSTKSLEVKYYTKAQPLFSKCLVFARSFRPGFLNHRVAKWQRVVTDFKWVVLG